MLSWLKNMFSSEPTPEPEEGPLTAKQVELVQGTWEKCVPIADKAADIFYDKLFELDAELRPLFPEEMSDQKKKLMTMITTAVRGLNNLEKIVPAVQQLGKGHVAYGVKDAHYDTVGAALIYTLGVGLGDEFTDEVKESWVAVYTLLATTMKDAASEVAA